MIPVVSIRFSLILFLLLSLGFISQAQAKPEHGKKFKDWTVVCEKLPNSGQEVCNIFQNVSNDQNKVVLQVAIGYPPGQTDAQALITLPLGVILIPGIEFTAGTAEAFRIPFSVCVKNGCVAISKLNDEVIKGMKAGNKGSVKFAAAQNQVVEIPVSLSGFTAAFNSLK